MLAALGYPIARRADRRDRPAGDPPHARRCALPRRVPRGRGARAAARRSRAKNQVLKSFIGQGYYGTHTPGVILRNVLENPAWYTAYTPYQPEISQGRLEALVNFQTMVCDLTGHGDRQRVDARRGDRRRRGDDARASASARAASTRFFVADDVLPQTIDVVRTRAAPLGIEVVVGAGRRARPPADASRVLLQYPGAERRRARLPRARRGACTRSGALVVVAADLLALTLLDAARRMGRRRRRRLDAALRRADGLRRPARRLPRHARRVQAHRCPAGWSASPSTRNGEPAYRLALQTREQHIRREKATSNICTAQVLLAVIASMYAVYHGPDGLATHRAARAPARPRSSRRASSSWASRCRPRRFFDTLTVATGDATARDPRRAASRTA